MAQIKLEVLKEADLTNNCPECFNQGLEISFYQKHSYGKFVHKTTKEVSSIIKCKKCLSEIYPVKWTPDIERVFDYYQKMVEPKKPSVKYTKLFHILILVLLALVAIGVFLYLESGLF
tara:strand:- start:58 stop:411 length:354 start_codon:yes stop_codon:yes gene_type:complete